VKQQITPDQLNELSDTGRSRLDGLLHGIDEWYNYYEEEERLLLSIGQMIAILDSCDRNYFRRHFIVKERSAVEGSLWALSLVPPGGHATVPQETHKELCDALWEALKQVLESTTALTGQPPKYPGHG
jgi:hypothetical protein